MVSRKNRPRRSAEETRRVLVEEGIRQLEVAGMDFGVEHLTLEAACVVTNVPRSSSHAAWALDDDFTPQAFYQRNVLKAWLEQREGLTYSRAAETALAEAFESRGESMSRAEIIRVAIQAAILDGLGDGTENAGSGLTSSDMAIKHTLASQPEHDRDPEIASWVRNAERSSRQLRIDRTFRPMAEMLGLRPRDEYGDAAFYHVAVAVASLHEGIAMRELILPELDLARGSIRDEGNNGIPATLLGVCVEAIVDKFFEPDLDAADARA